MKYRKALVSLAALSLCIPLAACGGRDDTSAKAEGDSDSVVSIDECQSYEASPGVTDDQILLGASYPSSGPLATLGQLAQGFNAYFDYANAELGGVDGRDVKVLGYDDGYDPSRTVTNVNKLVDKDKVLAMMAVLSTAGNYAIWDYLEASCVPLLMSSTAAATFEEAVDHRWTLDGMVPYRLEAIALANTLVKDQGVKTLAVLREAGDFGDAFMDGLESVGDELGLKIVASESFQATDPSVNTQVSTLAATGADAALVVAAGTMCAQAMDAIGDTSWDPVVALSYTCTSQSLMTLAKPESSRGVISSTALKDPGSARWKDDADINAYKTAVAKYAPKANENDSFVAAGWHYAEVIYNLLKDSKKLTRQDLMSAALSVDGMKTMMSLPGVPLKTSSDDPTLTEGVQIQQYDPSAKDWVFLDGAEPLSGDQTAIVEYAFADTQ